MYPTLVHIFSSDTFSGNVLVLWRYEWESFHLQMAASAPQLSVVITSPGNTHVTSRTVTGAILYEGL